VAAHAASRTLLPLHAAGMALGGRKLHPLARHLRGRKLVIRADQPLVWNLDGDLHDAGKLARVRIEPDVFRVIVA
jgi:diacylglycerol kinase family enzyme